MIATSIEQSKKLLSLGIKPESEELDENSVIGFDDIISPNYEIWKDIKGFEGRYKISSLGRVLSMNYQRKDIPVMLKIRASKDGYCYVTLRKDGNPKDMLIHRLVAEAFIPNPNNLPLVNHLDENPLHNFVFNLEWVDKYYNFHYGTADNRKLRSMYKAIYQCDLEGKIIKMFTSINEAASELKVDRRGITGNLCGWQKTAFGFKFFYVNKYNEPNHGFVAKYKKLSSS